MLDIDIETIPHKEQRCEGNVGDYWESNDGQKTHIRISQMEDKRSEYAVALHELIENGLRDIAGIPEPKCQAFDEEWFRQRSLGVPSKYDEPGEDPACPYHHQHMVADVIERIFIGEAGLHWREHCTNVENIGIELPKIISERFDPGPEPRPTDL